MRSAVFESTCHNVVDYIDFDNEKRTVTKTRDLRHS